MNNTALGAENKKKQTINFISEAHEKFYYEKLKEVRYQDVCTTRHFAIALVSVMIREGISIAYTDKKEVGTDPLGNITRINNALEAMPAQLEEAQTKLSNVEHQLETAKAEVNKPFAQEAELSEKLDRLTALNALLNMNEKGNDAIGMDEETLEAEPERKLADRPAERTSLKGKLSEMKARVSGTPAGRDAVDKTKGKETIL